MIPAHTFKTAPQSPVSIPPTLLFPCPRGEKRDPQDRLGPSKKRGPSFSLWTWTRCAHSASPSALLSRTYKYISTYLPPPADLRSRAVDFILLDETSQRAFGAMHVALLLTCRSRIRFVVLRLKPDRSRGDINALTRCASTAHSKPHSCARLFLSGCSTSWR